MQMAWVVGPMVGGLIAAVYVPAAYLASAGCTRMVFVGIIPIARTAHRTR